MNILLVHHEIPYPIRSGWDKMVYNLIRTLKTTHEVSLIAPIFRDTDQTAIKHVESICDRLLAVPIKQNHTSRLSNQMEHLQRIINTIFRRIPGYVSINWHLEVARAIEECYLSNHYDVIEAASIFVYSYLPHIGNHICRVLGPMDDGIGSVTTNLKYENRWYKKPMTLLQGWAVSHYENNAYLNSDWVLFYSKQDWQTALNRTPILNHARYCPVASECDVPSRKEVLESFQQQEPNTILFIGTLSPLFNQDAVLFFCKEVLPKIIFHIPDVKFYIVGYNPPPHIQQLAQNKRIKVTGGVPKDDLDNLLKKASVYVGPIRAGTGVKTKLIEAMSFGKAIVATTKSVAGLADLQEGVLLLRDDPEQMAQAIIDVLQDSHLRNTLGSRARDEFERRYSFDALLPKTLAVFDEIEHSIAH